MNILKVVKNRRDFCENCTADCRVNHPQSNWIGMINMNYSRNNLEFFLNKRKRFSNKKIDA